MSNNHFENRKPHTEIKHKLFTDTFGASLGIAAKYSKSNSFTYVDLYAGQGKFGDDSIGSPLIAFNEIITFKELSSFHQVKCYFSEKEEKNINALYKQIKLLSEKHNSRNVFAHIHPGEWSHTEPKLREFIQYSKWGFIFVDPFKNEVDLENLFDLIKKQCSTMELMIFINTQAIKRIAGLGTQNKKLADFLGTTEDSIPVIAKCNNQIRDCLQSKFSSTGKQFILNASLPTTKNDHLIKSDTFQLLLSTNSIGVANAFLKSYVEAVEIYGELNASSLFENLEYYILSLAKDFQEISLLKLFQELYKNNNSWKNADIYNIPTSDNVSSVIDRLLTSKNIKFETNIASLINTRNKRINKTAYRNNRNLREVRIIFINH